MIGLLGAILMFFGIIFISAMCLVAFGLDVFLITYGSVRYLMSVMASKHDGIFWVIGIAIILIYIAIHCFLYAKLTPIYFVINLVITTLITKHLVLEEIIILPRDDTPSIIVYWIVFVLSVLVLFGVRTMFINTIVSHTIDD